MVDAPRHHAQLPRIEGHPDAAQSLVDEPDRARNTSSISGSWRLT
jgi:hypothetical protein